MRAIGQPFTTSSEVVRRTMMVKKYGAVPPLQTMSTDPHSVKSEVSTSKLNPKAAGRIARTSEESSSIVVDVIEI
jgi:hypothetical protein